MTETVGPEPPPSAGTALPVTRDGEKLKRRRRRIKLSQVWVFFAGVVAGTIPAILTVWMQTRAQERQLLLDRRIAAMQSYLVACNRLAAPYLYPSEALEPDEPPKSSAEKATVRQEREHLNARNGEYRAQEALVAALFRISQGSLGLQPGWPPNIRTMTVKEFDDWYSQRAGAAQMRCADVGLVLGQRLFVADDANPITLPSAAGPPVAPEKPRAWQATPRP